MLGKRKESREKIVWTREMNLYLLECRDKAKALSNGEDPPRKPSGRKMGYMELMHRMFLERFPGLNSLKPQNLRDQISQAEKCQQSTQDSLVEVFNSEINSLQHNLLQHIPNIVLLDDNDISNSDDNDRLIDDAMNELECKACNKARELLVDVNRDKGNMCNRRWRTRNKNV